MKGSELKKTRLRLNLSQQALGDVLNMSRVMIGLMEREVQPIEKRTELAIRCLVYEAENTTIKNNNGVKK